MSDESGRSAFQGTWDFFASMEWNRKSQRTNQTNIEK